MKNLLIFTKSSFRNFLILLFCFSFILCSCSSTKGNVNDHSIYLPKAQEETEATVNACYLVIPANASSALIESADKLSKSIAESLDIHTKVYYDHEMLPSTENARFIFIGDTSYDISKLNTARLKINDYLCATVGKNIFLGGKSSTATITAIERFISDILPSLDLNEGIEKDKQFEYFGEYLYKNPTLNGYPLNDYTVVYPFNYSMQEKDIALKLAEKLTTLFGVCPTVLSETQVSDSQMLICIGACFGDTPTNAKIICRENSVKLCGRSANELAQSAFSFIETCKSSENVELDGETAVEYNDLEITLMRVFPSPIESSGALAQITNICHEIGTKKPSIICFDFPSDAERAQYENNLTDYTFIGNGVFVLSEKCAIVSKSITQNTVCADIRYLNNELRVISVSAKGQSQNAEPLSMLSDDGTSIVFTITDSDGVSVPSSDGVILNDMQSNNTDNVILTVFSKNNSASRPQNSSDISDPPVFSIFPIILTHPFLR